MGLDGFHPGVLLHGLPLYDTAGAVINSSIIIRAIRRPLG